MVKYGTVAEDKQRYRRRAYPERGRTFLLAYTYAGQSPAIRQQIGDRAIIASSIRDTVQVLHKKEPQLQHMTQAVFKQFPPEQGEVVIYRADKLIQRRGLTSEIDEMWRNSCRGAMTCHLLITSR